MVGDPNFGRSVFGSIGAEKIALKRFLFATRGKQGTCTQVASLRITLMLPSQKIN